MQNPSLTFFSLMQGREKNTSVGRHMHDCFEIVCFDKANGVLTIHENTYPLQDGTLYLVYPNTPHSEVHFSGATVSFLGFRCPDFPRHAIKEAAFPMLRHEEIGSMMKKIMKEATEQRPHYDALISHLLAEIILLLARYAAGNEQQPKNLGYIASYITEYFNQPLNLLQLAKDTGYSPDYFRHRFSDEFGMSPKQFQIEIRLKKAAELLLNSKKSCTEIAALCGFSTASQFSAMFSKKYQMPPNRFRQSDAPSIS